MELTKSLGKNPRTGLNLVASFENITTSKEESQSQFSYREIELDLQGIPYKPETAGWKTISTVPTGAGEDLSKSQRNADRLKQLRLDILLLVQERFVDFEL